MKKLSLLMAASVMAASVFAGLPSYVLFSSTGPDRYADGTEVLDGEVYALVWAKTGTAFAGFNADGSLVDTENNKLISAAAVALDGKCQPTVYILKGENSDLGSTGEFSVYLLDTRIAKADGPATVSGVTAGALAAVNTTSPVAASVTAGEMTTAETAVAASGATATAVPADTPNPSITAIKVVGGQVVVKVAGTVPYLQYGISAGKTPSALDQTDLVRGINGTEDGKLTLIVDQPEENRFFKVIRK